MLGAGNANDLDLPVLGSAFEEIHLVDLDSDALRVVVERHSTLDARVRLHGGIDLSGIASRLDRLSSPPSAGEIDELIVAARNPPVPEVDGPYNVVASTCLLTQLMNAAVTAVGDSHPGLLELLAAIRLGHLHLLASLVAPGGVGMLFTDIASSDEAPEIATASDPSQLAGELARKEKLFVEVDPRQIEEDLLSDPLIAPNVESVTSMGVWLWRISQARTFLVEGFSFRTVTGKRSK